MDLYITLDSNDPGWQIQPCDLREMKQVMTRWQRELEGRSWDGATLLNHDPTQAISRLGDDRCS